MPIDTPRQALLSDELPSASANESGIKAIVATNTGMKTLSLSVLFEPYSLLIGSYQFYAGDYPLAFAIPMMGGLLDPADFEDNLQILKQRVPNDWITAQGKIQLPLVLDHVLQQDLSLQMGQFQEDALQNVKGNFGGLHNHESNGPFKSGGGKGGFKGNYSDIQSVPVNFDLSRAARTAEKTRESTLNSLLCIITGQNKSKETKTYYVINPNHGAYSGWTITLPVGKSGQGIGFNPAVMSENEPAEFSQVALAESWAKETQSDPLGLTIRVKTRQLWDFSIFENIYKTFRVNGKYIFFSADMGGLKIMGDGGTHGIVFTGTPAFSSTAGWGSGYGVTYHSTSVIISGTGFGSFTITGLPSVNVTLRTKGCDAILSLVSNNKPIDSVWWANLSARCAADKLDYLRSWLPHMSDGIYNAANTQDTLDNIPHSRFYLHSSAYVPQKPSQAQLWALFQAVSNSDILGIYGQATSPSFRLSNYVPKEKRTFWIEGFEMEIEADATGIKFISKDHYYLRLAGTLRVGNQANYYGQNQQIIYDVTPPCYFVGAPDSSEIALSAGWTHKAMIAVKEKYVLLSFPGQGNYRSYLDLNAVNTLINSAPAGQEAAVREIFNHLPKDWDNTVNQDTMGENWGIARARFWMEGNTK